MDRRARSGFFLLALVAVVVGAVLAAQAVTGTRDGSAPSGAAVPATLVRATVIGISDGDTIRVRLDDGTIERVRYIGIDAPEVAHPSDGTAAECYGSEASAANAALVADRVVWLERDVSDRDRFGRLLRHVWSAPDGARRLVAEELVAQGMAFARSYPPDVAHDEQLWRAETAARTARRGLWAAC